MNHNTDILEKRLSELGVVLSDTLVLGGSYLLPSGKFVDLHKTYLKGLFPNSHYKTGVHCDIDTIMKNELRDLISDEESRKRNILGRTFGAIKLQDGIILSFERPYIIVPEVRPTEQQFSQLILWIYQTYKEQSNHSFMIGFREDCQRWYRLLSLSYDQEGRTPEDLIKEFNRFYNIASNQSWEDAINDFASV